MIKKIITRFESEYQSWCYGIGYEIFDLEWDRRPTPMNRVRFLFEMIPLWIKHLIGSWMCRRYGHGRHWHCEDWGGPESGGMAGCCDRCGFSFHHVLY